MLGRKITLTDRRTAELRKKLRRRLCKMATSERRTGVNKPNTTRKGKTQKGKGTGSKGHLKGKMHKGKNKGKAKNKNGGKTAAMKNRRAVEPPVGVRRPAPKQRPTTATAATMRRSPPSA